MPYFSKFCVWSDPCASFQMWAWDDYRLSRSIHGRALPLKRLNWKKISKAIFLCSRENPKIAAFSDWLAGIETYLDTERVLILDTSTCTSSTSNSLLLIFLFPLFNFLLLLYYYSCYNFYSIASSYFSLSLSIFHIISCYV